MLCHLSIYLSTGNNSNMDSLLSIEREKKEILQDFAASAKSFFADMLELKRGEVEAKKQYYALKAQQIELSNMLG